MRKRAIFEVAPDSITGDRATAESDADKTAFLAWSRARWRYTVVKLWRCAKSGHLSPDTAAELAVALERALDGAPPFAWASRPPGSYSEQYRMPPEIAALRYVAAANARLIADGNPVRTVSEIFGVHQRQYYRWKRLYSDHPAAKFRVSTSLAASPQYWEQIIAMTHEEGHRYRESLGKLAIHN